MTLLKIEDLPFSMLRRGLRVKLPDEGWGTVLVAEIYFDHDIETDNGLVCVRLDTGKKIECGLFQVWEWEVLTDLNGHPVYVNPLLVDFP